MKHTLLRKYRLRDTQPRRLVLKALSMTKKPMHSKEIHAWIERHDAKVDLVTVYRVLEAFEEAGIVHKHPSSGGVTLCSLPEHKGHHGFLSCEKCGTVEEFSDPRLCVEEDRVAKKAGFRSKHHMSDIVGVCTLCQ